MLRRGPTGAEKGTAPDTRPRRGDTWPWRRAPNCAVGPESSGSTGRTETQGPPRSLRSDHGPAAALTSEATEQGIL